MTYALVTVVHKPDYPLLRLQAQSLARYLPLDFTDEIYVIANQGLARSDGWQSPLLDDYGPLADRVRFIDAAQVAAIPSDLAGWRSQQILKLMIARFIESERYMVLDAKNHLVFPLLPEFYEERDRIRMRAVNYHYFPHMLRPLGRSLRYFGVERGDIANSFLPTDTPFVFPTHVVNALIDNVDRREQSTLSTAFDGLGVTEFLFFGAFVCALAGGIDQYYEMSGEYCPIIWRLTVEYGHVQRLAASVADERRPFFTVHREAFGCLDDSSASAIAAVWARRSLFDSVGHALQFIASVVDWQREHSQQAFPLDAKTAHRSEKP